MRFFCQDKSTIYEMADSNVKLTMWIKCGFTIILLFIQDVVRTLGDVPADSNNAIPKKTIKIVDSGVNNLQKKYDLTEEEFMSDDDINKD